MTQEAVTHEVALSELRVQAFKVLLKELGPRDYIRFVRDILGPPKENLADIRKRFNEMTFDEIFALIRANGEQGRGG